MTDDRAKSRRARRTRPLAIAVFIVVAVLLVIATLFYNAITRKARIRPRERAGRRRFDRDAAAAAAVAKPASGAAQ